MEPVRTATRHGPAVRDAYRHPKIAAKTLTRDYVSCENQGSRMRGAGTPREKNHFPHLQRASCFSNPSQKPNSLFTCSTSEQESHVQHPLYSYDLVYQGVVPERRLLKLERDGLAKVIRNRTGHVTRAVLRKRPGDPEPTKIQDYMGQGYSFKHHLNDGHRPWALKPLGHRFSRTDQSIEYHLAPVAARPIFLAVLLDCLSPTTTTRAS